MPMFDFRCTNCSFENEHLEPSTAPLRPCDIEGCIGIMERVYRGKAAQPLADSIPGGLVLENYGPVPVTVYSHSERRALMKERGLEVRDVYNPHPGTDKSPIGNTKWSKGIDAQTMENARILLSRGAVRIPTRKYMDDGSVIDTDVADHNRELSMRPFNYNGTDAPQAMRDLVHRVNHREGE